MKLVALWCLLAAGCMNSHSGTQALAQSDCYTCHKPDYENTPQIAMVDTAVPNHLADPATYTTQCASCHVTSTWLSHPELQFAIRSGPHANIECTSCHLDPNDNAGDQSGKNTQCATCHTPTEPIGAGTMTTGHSDQTQFSYTSPPAGFTPQNFCLSCHPDGREIPHDATIFPLTGHHNLSDCNACHDRSKSSDAMGLNADCRRCHSNSDISRVGDHPANITTLASPSGCLAKGCHYGGQSGN